MALSNFVVLVIDDDEVTQRFLRREMADPRLRVLTASNAEEAISQLSEQRPDVILLAPPVGGWEFIGQMRRISYAPIIAMAFSGEWRQDVLQALGTGADCFIFKPLDVEVLWALIFAQLRRAGLLGNPHHKPLHLGKVSVDFENRAISGEGAVFDVLSPTEWRLLAFFSIHQGQVLTYDDILAHVWGLEYRGEHHLVHDWVSRLRRKLREAGLGEEAIETIPRVGYHLRWTQQPESV